MKCEHEEIKIAMRVLKQIEEFQLVECWYGGAYSCCEPIERVLEVLESARVYKENELRGRKAYE